jgi:5-methylcytosine-specific restriction protein A
MALPATKARQRRRAAIARGNDAAARLRKTIRLAGMVKCARCPQVVFASAADIDHITPLAKGGQDVDSNVQILCRPCHKLKTRSDFEFRKPPF